MSALRRLLFLAAALLALAVATVPRTARAEAPNPRALPVYVLEVDTDDADDQADALTSALRSRIRTAPGWSLLETNQTLAALMVALKCPPKPDTICLQRIGDQLRADRFVWGTLAKGPAGQVTADLHLWARGKPEGAAKEAYSENLKDPGDESLRKISARLFDRITGVTTGTLVVSSTVDAGAVFVDGEQRAQLERGQARIDLPSGEHAVEVRAAGFAPSKQSVAVAAGAETQARFTLAPGLPEDATSREEAKKPFPVRRVLAWTAIGLGAVGLVAGGIEAGRFVSATDELKELRSKVPDTVKDVCSEDSQSIPTAVVACRKVKEARDTQTRGWIFAGVGGALAITGVILLVTDKGGADADAPKRARVKPGKVDVLPSLSPAYSGVDLSVTF